MGILKDKILLLRSATLSRKNPMSVILVGKSKFTDRALRQISKILACQTKKTTSLKLLSTQIMAASRYQNDIVVG